MVKRFIHNRLFSIPMLLITLCVLLSTGFSLSAADGDKSVDDGEQLFHKGVELYKAGQFKKSSDMFERILDNGYTSGEVYFNLGNAYLKQGNLAGARIAYERASGYLPRDTDVAGNLAYLKSRLPDKIELPEPSLVWKSFYYPGMHFNKTELAVAVLVVYGIIMALWLVMALMQSFRMVMKIFIIVCITLFVWLGSVFTTKLVLSSHPREAVVVPEQVAVRWGNTENDKVAFYLHSGTKVIIRQMREEWALITIGDNKSGWVKKNAMEVI